MTGASKVMASWAHFISVGGGGEAQLGIREDGSAKGLGAPALESKLVF